MHDQIAHILPTHERPAMCQRLVDSILRQWPEARVYVCDDSKSPSTYDGATDVQATAYDIGLSAKRNLLVEASDEPYLMLWDDDYIAYEATDLMPFWAVLQKREDIGIVGGEWLLGGRRRIWFAGEVTPDGPVKRHRPPQGSPESLRYDGETYRFHECDFVPNWLMARRETLELVPWDEELKLQEHIEYFCRMAAIRAQHGGAPREEAWRERYQARARGEAMYEAAGDRRLVYAHCTFSNARKLSHLEGHTAKKGQWIEVAPGYADQLEEKGLVSSLTEMTDTRPFPLPDNAPPGSGEHVPVGVALAVETTCVHDRDHDVNEDYNESRTRDKFWRLQHQKLGCQQSDMVQWSDYPHGEPDFPTPSEEILTLN